MFGGIVAFVIDHLITGGALVLAGIGLWARLSGLPFARQIATVLWIAAAAAGAYGQGYARAKLQDRSAALVAEAEQLKRDIESNKAIAAASTARAEAAETERDQNNAKAEKLAADLAAKGSDCPIPEPVRVELRDIGADQAKPPGSATGLRKASPAPARVGAIATLAKTRAALGTANRRLLNDRAFYDDVRKQFSR